MATKKIFSTVFQYLFLALLGAVGYAVYSGRISIHFFHIAGSMGGAMALAAGLSLASLWVEVWRIGVTKPFNCVACLTGWFSLFIAFGFHTSYWYFYLPIGHLVGSLYFWIKNRWL